MKPCAAAVSRLMVFLLVPVQVPAGNNAEFGNVLPATSAGTPSAGNVVVSSQAKSALNEFTTPPVIAVGASRPFIVIPVAYTS